MKTSEVKVLMIENKIISKKCKDNTRRNTRFLNKDSKISKLALVGSI